VKANFVCPACKATVTAPASLQGEAYPCPKCKAAVDCWPAPINSTASAPAAARAPAPASAPASVRVIPQPPPVEQAVWFYSANGSRRGPVTAAQLKAQVESGVVRSNDLVWREGMPAWVEASTVPELFPKTTLAKAPPPVPAPAPAAPPPPQQDPLDFDDDRRGRRSRRENREDRDERPIQVHVHQTMEQRDEDRRPRRRREGFECPFCGSTERPIVKRQVSGAGWVVFFLLLFFTIIFCFVGLFMQEDVRVCRDCGAKLGA
jgi:hypothetical protein